MTTLIAVYTSDGCIGRCDAKCYNAKDLECDCICNGLNHGAGVGRAVQQTREHLSSMIKAYGVTHPDAQIDFVQAVLI